MNQGKYVFSQIMETVIRYRFDQCVARYKGEHRVKNLTCWEQFMSLSFGQLSFRKSLRDIVICLAAHRQKLYHLGFQSAVYLPTLARANERRDWRIYRDFAVSLIAEARKLYADDKLPTLEISEAVYVLDSTTIELCLALFPWAHLPRQQAAIKMHLGLELHGNIPSFFDFSRGKEADIFFLDRIDFWPRHTMSSTAVITTSVVSSRSMRLARTLLRAPKAIRHSVVCIPTRSTRRRGFGAIRSLSRDTIIGRENIRRNCAGSNIMTRRRKNTMSS